MTGPTCHQSLRSVVTVGGWMGRVYSVIVGDECYSKTSVTVGRVYSVIVGPARGSFICLVVVAL